MSAPAPVRWVGRSLYDGRDAWPDGRLDDRIAGCPRAAGLGVGAPVVPTRLGPAPPTPGPTAPGLGAMWRWAEHLVPGAAPVSLGEGGTPLVALPAALRASRHGRVLVKDERANPTGSFKDRLAAAALARARGLGAHTVAAASSGNAGLAVAAAAAASGLRCVVLTAGPPPAPTAAELAAHGAVLLTVEDPDDRWTALRAGVDALGWFPVTNHAVPPVSSHPAGVHAYRTIAYEIAEALGGRAPDHVVVPVSRGDGLFGIAAGFAELVDLGRLDTVPRMVAVERHPSLRRALDRGDRAPATVTDGPDADPAVSRSIGDRRATFMGLETLRRTGGTAVTVDDADLRRASGDLARAGLALETSAAAVLAGLHHLDATGLLDPSTTTVLVATAGPRAQATLPAPGDPGPPLRDPGDLDEIAARTDPHRRSTP